VGVLCLHILCLGGVYATIEAICREDETL